MGPEPDYEAEPSDRDRGTASEAPQEVLLDVDGAYGLELAAEAEFDMAQHRSIFMQLNDRSGRFSCVLWGAIFAHPEATRKSIASGSFLRENRPVGLTRLDFRAGSIFAQRTFRAFGPPLRNFSARLFWRNVTALPPENK